MLKRTMLIRVAGMLATAAMVFSLAACKKTAETSSSTSKEKGKSQQQTGTEASTEIKWPKNVEIVVPAGAGGDTDFNSRLLAQKLSERLPANFVVSNVTGNSGATGSRQVKEAESDGGTVLFYHTAFLVNQASKTTDYGIEQYSFACIAAMSRGNVVTVRSDLGIQTLKELYEYTQSHPGELKMAAQTGATSYAIAMQMKRAGFDMNVVDAGGAATVWRRL
ncbi:tripartite tricarboxylate transporter substrate-binding protein [Clostridium sp. AM58-1XD]|uniref:tripartite tricarboxylate transporter substrate-binding protein n=1 Tax=Clostridium sp. AM58-1XD TaxID=2292307 RepID=UPI000E5013CB|nr:tripartite tricarboxylate transporter substrate-binding protein [Clostridium sp. AM58-1XD]RGY96672.1 hypothetical protein DXA13_16730 [Clostridium sp. AM58-1XD]